MLTVDPAYYATRNLLRDISDLALADIMCTQCGHLHFLDERQPVFHEDVGHPRTQCPGPECLAVSYYDLTTI